MSMLTCRSTILASSKQFQASCCDLRGAILFQVALFSVPSLLCGATLCPSDARHRSSQSMACSISCAHVQRRRDCFPDNNLSASGGFINCNLFSRCKTVLHPLLFPSICRFSIHKSHLADEARHIAGSGIVDQILMVSYRSPSVSLILMLATAES